MEMEMFFLLFGLRSREILLFLQYILNLLVE